MCFPVLHMSTHECIYVSSTRVHEYWLAQSSQMANCPPQWQDLQLEKCDRLQLEVWQTNQNIASSRVNKQHQYVFESALSDKANPWKRQTFLKRTDEVNSQFCTILQIKMKATKALLWILSKSHISCENSGSVLFEEVDLKQRFERKKVQQRFESIPSVVIAQEVGL